MLKFTFMKYSYICGVKIQNMVYRMEFISKLASLFYGGWAAKTSNLFRAIHQYTDFTPR